MESLGLDLLLASTVPTKSLHVVCRNPGKPPTTRGAFQPRAQPAQLQSLGHCRARLVGSECAHRYRWRAMKTLNNGGDMAVVTRSGAVALAKCTICSDKLP